MQQNVILCRFGTWARTSTRSRVVARPLITELAAVSTDIAYANGEYQKYLRHQYHNQSQSTHTQKIEQDRLRDMKSRLNFD